LTLVEVFVITIDLINSEVSILLQFAVQFDHQNHCRLGNKILYAFYIRKIREIMIIVAYFGSKDFMRIHAGL
jgi:hypothetical protein